MHTCKHTPKPHGRGLACSRALACMCGPPRNPGSHGSQSQGRGTGGARQKSGRWKFGVLRTFENRDWGAANNTWLWRQGVYPVGPNWVKDRTGRSSAMVRASPNVPGQGWGLSGLNRMWDMPRGQRGEESPLPARFPLWCWALGLQDLGLCWPSASPWWPPRERW